MMKQDTMDLLGVLERLEWLLRRNQVMNHMAHGPMGNPHRGQGRVLTLLKLHPEISQKDLSHILDIRAQSLGELLSKLEKNGYITRSPSQEDRRVMMIRLTDAGAQAVSEMDAIPDDDLFFCLTQEEQQTLAQLLSRVVSSLEDRLGKEDHHRGHGHRGGFRGGFPDRGGIDPRHMRHMGGMNGRGGMGGAEHGPHGCRPGWGYGGSGEDFVDFDQDDEPDTGDDQDSNA